jgi:outer membrane protein assembly factor BamB
VLSWEAREVRQVKIRIGGPQARLVALVATLVGPVAASAARRDRQTGTAPAWRAPLGDRGGGIRLEVVDGLVVARQESGETASFDLASGRRRATLVGAPRRCEAPSESCTGDAGGAIDPDATTTAVLHGALVGPRGVSIAALDVRTGRTLWRAPIPDANPDLDELALRDRARLVEAGSLDVLGWRHARPAAEGSRASTVEESLLALDPATGAVRWRKVVVARPRGELDEPMRIAGCADLVVAWTAGRLVAVEAATGAERWPVALGDATPPLVSCAADRVAVATQAPAFDASRAPGAPSSAGVLRWLGAADGAEVARFALPGGTLARHLVAGRASVVVALQDDAAEPPAASVVELAMPSGETRWRRALRYDVVQLRADDASVHALAGDGRLWSIARDTGELRWGLSAGMVSTFAVGSTGRGGPRVVLPIAGAVAAWDPAPRRAPAPMAPYLRLEHADERGRDEGPRCRSVALSWVDGEENVVWRRELPARFQGSEAGTCAAGTAVLLRRRPRLTAGFLELGATVVVARAAGVLALDRRSGEVVLDLDAPPEGPEGDTLYFDGGTFSLSGTPSCTGRSDRAFVFERCASRVLFFNGSTAALLGGRPFAVEARAVFSQHMARALDEERPHGAVIPLGRRTLVIGGRISDR